jgi:oxalate decarboxylase/phosphoglucose isomerase-like protein (cupin superfamily)
MAFRSLLLAVMVLFAATSVVEANDPDPLQDFCVADESNKIFINGFPCKDPATVVSEDFTYRGLRNQGKLSTSFGAPLQKAFVQQFPGINTQGISWARLDFAYPGGLNVPHWHQRATEILSCQKGQLLVGFVDTNNKLWSTVLQPGDITMFPRGLVHFQLNVGTGPASAVLALNSQNAGRSDIGASTFGAGIQEEILEIAFGLSVEAVKSLESFFNSPPASK